MGHPGIPTAYSKFNHASWSQRLLAFFPTNLHSPTPCKLLHLAEFYTLGLSLCQKALFPQMCDNPVPHVTESFYFKKILCRGLRLPLFKLFTSFILRDSIINSRHRLFELLQSKRHYIVLPLEDCITLQTNLNPDIFKEPARALLRNKECAWTAEFSTVAVLNFQILLPNLRIPNIAVWPGKFFIEKTAYRFFYCSWLKG